MPQYDYRCQDCRHVFTIERSMSETAEPECNSCGQSNVSRIWNAFILSSGSTPDVGQGTARAASSKKSGCGSCSSHSCGTCH